MTARRKRFCCPRDIFSCGGNEAGVLECISLTFIFLNYLFTKVSSSPDYGAFHGLLLAKLCLLAAYSFGAADACVSDSFRFLLSFLESSLSGLSFVASKSVCSINCARYTGIGRY